MSKHTPGPWFTSPSIPTRVLKQFTGGKIVNELVCRTDYSWATESERRANARLIAAAPELLEALEAHQAAQAMPIYGDYSDFVWPKSEMREPGEPAWGWICEKHGLGYQGGCICCSDDFKRHQDNKDQAARYARDNALNEASNKARAAIRKATGEQA